ncbi:MAG: dehydrogenase subunit [Thermoplasmata archaeon]|jgi:NADH-quinone oxidoreductase subunit N|nr:dehydrogenase subunit [Thermoplasmata archaeon]
MDALGLLLLSYNPLEWISNIPFEWQAATPEFVVLLFALLAPLVGLWDTDRKGMQQFALIGLIGGFLLTLGSLLNARYDLPFTDVDFTLEYIDTNIGGIYAISYASQLLKLLFLGVGVIAVLGIGRPLKGKAEEDYGEFYSLLLFATFGMMVVASAQELFTLFLGIELTSMSSYLLAAFRRDRVGSEAGLKYFVIGAISSGMTLFAISLLYGMSGTTIIADMAATITVGGSYDAASLLAIVLLLAGLGFKISAVPFHAWAPDVYSGAPVPVAGVLASASKAMGFVAIFQVFLVGLVGVKSNWELAVGLLAVITMTVGNLVALQQTNLRRMLAYSSIAQAGYLLIAVAVGTWFAVGGGIFHLLTNAAMKLGAFLIVGALLYAGIPDHIDGWKGLGKRAPLLAFAMTVFLLSMAGLPPFGGFASKFVLFSGAVDVGVTEGLGWLTWLAVAAVLNSALSLYYYLRVIRAMYVDAPETVEGAAVERIEVPMGTTVAVLLCLGLVLAMGLVPQPFVEVSMKAAQDLLLSHAASP